METGVPGSNGLCSGLSVSLAVTDAALEDDTPGAPEKWRLTNGLVLTVS